MSRGGSKLKKTIVPNYDIFIEPVFSALKQLGGSGTNQEINDKATTLLGLTEDVLNVSHKNGNQSEADYRLAWARTYLRMFGAIENSSRGVWSITADFSDKSCVNKTEVVKMVKRLNKSENYTKPEDDNQTNDNIEFPYENKPWKEKLENILLNMNPYAFERLAQRLLRECGFIQVEVTKKSGDGGIDGFGKMKINGVFSYNVAFQCKRYSGAVPPKEIRDFRGSLPNSIEKAVFITTGTFSKAAKEDSCDPSKTQIDLIDGEQLIDMLAKLELGVKSVQSYEVIEEFFNKI